MPVTALSLGLQTVLVANQVYALPAASTQISWQSSAGSDLLVSLDGVNFSSLAGASAPNQALSAFTAAAFVKCATANTSVLCKNAPVAGGLTGSGSSTVTGNLTVTGNVTGASGIFDILKLDKTNQDVVLSRGGAGVLTLKNGANPQTLQVFGNASQGISLSHDGTNGHLATAGQLLFNVGGGDRWAISSSTLYPLTDNVYDIGGPGGAIRRLYVATSILNANGTAAAPVYSFSGNTNAGIFQRVAGFTMFSSGGVECGYFGSNVLALDTRIGFCQSGQVAVSGPTAYIEWESVDALCMRRTTNPQNFNIYNTYTNASNYERLFVGWTGNQAYVVPQSLGTGVARHMNVGSNDAGADFNLRSAGSTRWIVQSTGNFIANADNTYDIGASGANRPRNIYAAGNVIATAVYGQPSGGLTLGVNGSTGVWQIFAGVGTFLPLTDNTYDIGGGVNRVRNLFVGSSLISKVKAGTPVDADVTNPADGMMVMDSTANKIWVRLGGTWKGVVVA